VDQFDAEGNDAECLAFGRIDLTDAGQLARSSWSSIASNVG
jgi:hypothetical protein